MSAATVVCRSCGEVATDPAARYCEGCGKLLDGAKPSLLPAPPVPTWAESMVDDALAVASDAGRRHGVNQDRGIALRRADGAAALAVSDGVSNSETPELAAAAATDAVGAAFETATGSVEEVAAALAAAAVRAVAALPSAPPRAGAPAVDPPEATLVVAVARDGRVGVAWAGDSRAYLVEGGLARTLTRDDSRAEEAVEAGLSREEAMALPDAHAILQCLGMPDGDVDVHVVGTELPAGAALMLASDGLWNYFDSPSAMGAAYAAASAGTNAVMACRALVAKANACGGRDNITVAILRAPG